MWIKTITWKSQSLLNLNRLWLYFLPRILCLFAQHREFLSPSYFDTKRLTMTLGHSS